MDVPLKTAEDAGAFSATEVAPTLLVCGLAVEERAAANGGARAWRLGPGARGALPNGRLVSFGLAGALVPGLEPGALVTARRVVGADGAVLWEGEPLPVSGALAGVVCDAGRVVDDPDARRELAARTGAIAVDMESGSLAASGRLAGVVRAISDTPARPVGRLAGAATGDGRTDWAAVARSVLTEPRTALRAAVGARRALASLRSAAAALAEGGR